MTRGVFFGDIVGRTGRKALAHYMPMLIKKYKQDFTVINGENSAGGFGLTRKVYDEFMAMGVTALTMGNHWADKKEIYEFIRNVSNIALPANMGNIPPDYPKIVSLKLKNNKTINIINLIGRVFMGTGSSSPFLMADQVLMELPRDGINLIDMHAETTSEKNALLHYVAGRVSFLWGTHTHIQTADERISMGHTGYITDIGMTGAYDSVIGIKKEQSLARFLGSSGSKSFSAAEKDPWVCGVVVDFNDQSGACCDIQRFRLRMDEDLTC